jgi:peptidoglycan L-alanyl-D-glutamate endopeptidase CwlK
MLNSRDIDALRPDVAANCRAWMARCQAAGLPVCITGTVRDKEYQEYCYRMGTSKATTPSFHAQGIGLAFDFCKNVKGGEYADLKFFAQAAALAKEMGFSWGGDWKSFVDRPHIQWDEGGKYTAGMILSGRRPPAMPLWSEKEEDEDVTIYHWFADMPDWARPSAEKAYQKGILSADATGAVSVYEVNLQALVWMDRLGLLDGKGESRA